MGSDNVKFNVGDLVKVINKDLEAYGHIGTVVSVDEEWVCPYEIKFDDSVNTETFEELFYETDLALVERAEKVEPKEPRDFINIKFKETVNDEGATIQDVIDLLIEETLKKRKGKPYIEYSMTVTKLREAKMWLDEIEPRKGR